MCSVVVGYQLFRGPGHLHLQGEEAIVRENGICIDPDQEGVAGAASQ